MLFEVGIEARCAGFIWALDSGDAPKQVVTWLILGYHCLNAVIQYSVRVIADDDRRERHK